MSGGRATHLPTLAGLLGQPAEVLEERLGPPDTDTRVDRARWLIYDREGISLRLRCSAAGRIASWTASFADGQASLRPAAEALGLWPGCAPDQVPDPGDGMLRSPLRDSAGGSVYSLTARVRAGQVVQITAFDEPPEWLGADQGGDGEPV